MGVGIGGLVTNLMQGDPTQQIANALAGPNPNPQAAAGGAPSPSGAPGQANQQQQQMPPAQAYAPDPANASTIALLLKVHQQDMAANSINQGIDRIGASFGTAQQQHDKLAALNSGGPGQDTLGALQEITQLQKGQFELQQKQRFQASADLLGKTVLGLGDGQGAMLASNPELFNLVAQHKLKDQDLTETQKNINSWEKGEIAIGTPPAQIQQMKTQLLGGIIGGSDLEERQYIQEKAAGRTNLDYADWKAGKSAAAGAQMTQAKDAQEFKDSATQDYTNVSSTLNRNKGTVGQLLGNMDATMKALQYPDLITSGKSGAWSPVDQKVKEQAAAMHTLMAELTGEGLKNVKNVRNKMEFETLGRSLTAALDPANSPEKVKAALQEIQNKFLDAQATSEMAVGHKLTGDLVGHGNRDLLDPKNPYYNGATEDTSAGETRAGPQGQNDFSGMSGAEVDKAVAALPSGAVFIGPDGKKHTRK